MTRYAIIGPAQSGKSTFAGFLANELNTTFTDLSAWIVKVETIRQRRMAEQGYPDLESWDESRNRPRRELLIALGDAVCEIRPSFLIERAFEAAPIISGVRRIEEFTTLSKDILTVYINRPDAPKIKDTFNIPPSMVDIIIDNTSTLDALRTQAVALAHR